MSGDGLPGFGWVVLGENVACRIVLSRHPVAQALGFTDMTFHGFHGLAILP